MKKERNESNTECDAETHTSQYAPNRHSPTWTSVVSQAFDFSQMLSARYCVCFQLCRTLYCGDTECLFVCVFVHNTHAALNISNRLPPPAPTPHSHSSGRYPYLRQRRSKWWGCGAVVRPINWTNGGLTALCALRGEHQPPAVGQAERAGGLEEEGEASSSCGLW